VSAQNRGINFLLKDQFEKLPLSKFIKWALGFGKYIVILTELIVVVAFIARFKLDQDLNKLSKEISQKQHAVASFGSLESDVRVVQKQLQAIREKLKKQPHLAAKLSELSLSMPKDTFLEELNFSETSLFFTGISPTEASFATLLDKMQKSQIFTDIVVDSVSSGGARDPTISFRIRASFAKEE